MKKINYMQIGTGILFISLVGCATNNPGTSALGTADKSLASVAGAAQGGQQMLNAGAAVAGASGMAGAAGASQIGLVDLLVHKLNVSPQQALGGAGAIFQMAKAKMEPQAFGSLTRSISGMDTMLAAAPASPAGGMSSLAGGAGSSLGGAAALAGSFQQLNLSPDLVGRFIPIVTNYVKQMSGPASAGLFQSALGVR